jgi:hypothetical protein
MKEGIAKHINKKHGRRGRVRGNSPCLHEKILVEQPLYNPEPGEMADLPENE